MNTRYEVFEVNIPAKEEGDEPTKKWGFELVDYEGNVLMQGVKLFVNQIDIVAHINMCRFYSADFQNVPIMVRPAPKPKLKPVKKPAAQQAAEDALEE